MTQPYRYQPFTVQYVSLPDEAALLVHRTQRRAGLSTISGKLRSIYGKRKTPFTDDFIVSLYRIHQAERCHACKIQSAATVHGDGGAQSNGALRSEAEHDAPAVA